MPVYPSIGNHDADEREACDDRAQVEDNFYLCERLPAKKRRPGLVRPGAVLPVPLRLGHRVRLHRHLEGRRSSQATGCSRSRSTGRSSRRRFRPAAGRRPRWRHPVRAPSAVQRRPAASQHAGRWNGCCRSSSAPACKAMFSGHEHNFQHSSVDGIDYFVTGGAGRARAGAPDRFDDAHTRRGAPRAISCWSESKSIA